MEWRKLQETANEQEGKKVKCRYYKENVSSEVERLTKQTKGCILFAKKSVTWKNQEKKTRIPSAHRISKHILKTPFPLGPPLKRSARDSDDSCSFCSLSHKIYKFVQYKIEKE